MQLAEKEIKTQGAGRFALAAFLDANRYSDECRVVYTPRQRAQAESFRDIVAMAYTNVRSEPTYRKQWITVKVERGALVRDRKIVNEINAICQERDYQRVVTPQGTLFRMPKA